MNVLISVLIISLIGAVLATLIVIAEIFLANYGQCEITVNNDKKITVEGGKTLLSTLTEEKIFIPSACGGKGTCGLCKMKVDEGAGAILPTETPFLTDEEKEGNIRLSCQVKVRNDMKIQVPEELFNIQEYKCVCESIKDLTHDIKLFSFKLKEPKEINFVPGKYVQLLAPKYEKSSEEVYRAYSIASDPAVKDSFDLIIRLVPGGICTTYCFEYLKEGDPVKCNGPYGDFHLSEADSDMIFIAGGSGMAPFVSMLYEMVNKNINRKATYFFGANKVKELFMLDLMKEFEDKLDNFKFVPVVASPDEDEKWDGQTGLVTEAVDKLVDNASECEAYLCGSPGMIDASIKVLNGNLGVKESNIFYDKFA